MKDLKLELIKTIESLDEEYLVRLVLSFVKTLLS